MSLEPLPAVTHWLVRHAGFPARRLEARAELALCVAALAAAAEAAPSAARGPLATRDPAQPAALRAHGLRRSQVHYKCDNSAKV
ncbi:MAG: hypothetical protein ACKOUK_12205 [Verrucomicrobiota bacterium]